MSRKAILIDTSRCIGCRACQGACKSLNALPFHGTVSLTKEYTVPGSLSADSWTRVVSRVFDRNNRLAMTVQMCNHCEN
ncbi:MAG TPA: 4Fe-4S binding protein, partial [Spirochaetota bacterium]